VCAVSAADNAGALHIKAISLLANILLRRRRSTPNARETVMRRRLLDAKRGEQHLRGERRRTDGAPRQAD